MGRIDDREIRRWYDIFHSDNPLVETRLIGEQSRRISSGYFTDVEILIKELSKYSHMGIYAPINEISQGCYGRLQHDVIIDNPKQTTSETDIVGRRWLFIDIDPIRTTGVNATEEEKQCARQVMIAVGEFLRDQGFESPVIIDSANGYHLYYRINLENNPFNTQLLKDFYAVLDMFYTTSRASIDTAVSDPNRIAKIPGTYSNKGADTEDRPQRICRIIKSPEEIVATPKVYIEKIAGMLPKVEAPRFNGYSTEKFDVRAFLSRHNIVIAKESRFHDGEKLILQNCPFNSNHKAPDSAVFIMNNGAIGFRCLHNSCSHFTWRDLRLMYEPDAYNKKDIAQFQQKIGYYNREIKPNPIVVSESEDKGKKWQKMSDITYIDPSTLTYIPTGFIELDKVIGGLALGELSVITGLASAGKTSILNCMMLNAIDRGNKVAIWSGELQPSRFQAWIDQAAAGKGFVEKKIGYESWYYCPKDTASKINKWLDDKLWLYNNAYGNKWSQLFTDIKECVENNKTQLVILDNLASMHLDSFAGDKNDKQTQFITELAGFVKSSNIHAVLVAHPRKEMNLSFIRMESISGASDLFNLADNVFLCHRVGRDFQKRATMFFGKDEVERLMEYNGIVEVSKNRTHGVNDKLIGLYFEKESRRFKCTKDEYIIYGWQEKNTTPSLESYTNYYEPTYNNEDTDKCPF